MTDPRIIAIAREWAPIVFEASIGTAVILLLCVAAADLGRWLWN